MKAWDWGRQEGGRAQLRTTGFDLADWQLHAVDAWERGTADGPFLGTLEVFTGGGKTLIALSCAERAARHSDSLRLAIVVPTEALARQWIEVLRIYTDLQPGEIGLLGAGGQDSLDDHRVLVAVLNTAAKRLPDMSSLGDGANLMLIVDECHRAGAPSFSRVLHTRARFRLGLSATPDRDEVDEAGELLAFDEQLVGRLLGPVVFRFSLKDARSKGWLPEFEIHHHAIQLRDDERRRYEEITHKVDDLADQLSAFGIDPSQARGASARNDDAGRAAAAWVAATAHRKDLLYRASERGRIATRLVSETVGKRSDARVLLFHERVDEATQLYSDLVNSLPTTEVVIEHSRLPQRERQRSLAKFRSGEAPVLVSVRSLIEGIDVPEADTGVSVASSSSVRQRIQSLGRVLRRSRDAGRAKVAVMHVIYVRDSVDDLIYAKEDWADLTGEASNLYWSWSLDSDEEPESLSGPPHTPFPSEEQEWLRLGSTPPTTPVQWLGQWPQAEYSVDSRGTVRNRTGAVVANPQGVTSLISRLKETLGGRFGVTPRHRIVIARAAEPPRELFAVGCLLEPFSIWESDPDKEVERETLAPGDEYAGSTAPASGRYKLSQKRGGVIERRAGSGTQFALTSGSGQPELENNAVTVLAAWRSISTTGMQFVVNNSDDAVYWEGGIPRFLAHVPGGFCWPTQAHSPAEPKVLEDRSSTPEGRRE